MRKFLVPVVGALLAMLFTTGAAAAGDGPPEPTGPPDQPGPSEEHPLPPRVGVIGEASEEFRECLREQGVELPEMILAAREEGIPLPRLDERREGGVDGETAKRLRAALEECRSLLPDDVLPMIPAERLEEFREAREGLVECLREQGVDVEEFEDGRSHLFRFFGGGDEEEAEAFREAVEACRGTLPHDIGERPARMPA